MTFLYKITAGQLLIQARDGEETTGTARLKLPTKKRKYALLTFLHVKPYRRGEGIGEQLAREVERWTRAHGMSGRTWASPFPYDEEKQKRLFAWYLRIGYEAYNPKGYEKNQWLKF